MLADGPWGFAHESLINAVHEQDEAARFLAWPGDFDPDRGGGEEIHLASGAALEGSAGDGAGGTLSFCGEDGEDRPLLCADSEGRAALIAIGLPELLQLLLVAPWWRDCQTFTAQESRKLAAEYLEDMPDLVARRDRAAAVLGLVLPAAGDVLARLPLIADGGPSRRRRARARTPPRRWQGPPGYLDARRQGLDFTVLDADPEPMQLRASRAGFTGALAESPRERLRWEIRKPAVLARPAAEWPSTASAPAKPQAAWWRRRSSRPSPP